MKKYTPKKTSGPVVIKAKSSNELSDEYRDSIAIEYSFIGSREPEIRFEFAGKEFTTPVMAGPISAGKIGDGVIPYAKAVANAGSVFWSDYHDKDSWEKILGMGIPAVRVIKPLKNIDRLIEEIRFDESHGAIGYAMDISHGITVYGESDGQAEPFAAKSKDDLTTINSASSLPFFIKDIMSVHDAVIAAEIGAAGIVISGHNNRFPCTVPPLKLLPLVVNAVGGSVKIYIDGGLNTGYDVFKALALGADGVLCARTVAAAYAKEGCDGVTDKLLEITAELRGAMANTNSPDLKNINKKAIVFVK